MDPFGFAPLASLLFAVYAAVTGFAHMIEPAFGSASAAVAIVALTLAVRTILIPVGFAQVKADVVRRRLAPELARLRRRYSSNPQVLQRKTADLYRSEGANPFAGVLPTMAQVPVVSVVYALFVHPMIAGHANVLLSASVLGAPLGSSLVSTIGAASFVGGPLAAILPSIAVFAVLLTIMALIAGLTRRTAIRSEAEQTLDLVTPAPRATAAMSWLPFITVLFAAVVPLAATIYLTVTTAWTFVERALIRRRLMLAG